MSEMVDRADGKCRTCGGPVPSNNANLFYCNEDCRKKGWLKHHPEKDEKDFR